uniref:Calponin n=1 Tax=Hippocampus comes TaxID=109280 RepID=A0A3Q3DLC7_HIPCM
NLTMSFNRGPSYGLTAEVRNKIAMKYDLQKEEELRIWIEDLTGATIGDDFQNSLKSGVILCQLINKLRPGSVKTINHSSLNWHQLENLTNFITAIKAYGLKPHDTFEANDLFENGNKTQLQTTLLALASMAKTNGAQSRVDIGVKYADKQKRTFDEEKLKAGQCVIGLQMGTNKCASQAGMNAYGTRRHLYDPKCPMLPPRMHSFDFGVCPLRAIYDQKLGTDKCDNSTMSLQMGYSQGANQSGQNFGLGRQIYDAKYCTKGGEVAEETNGASGAYIPDYQDEGYQGYQEEEQVYREDGTDY